MEETNMNVPRQISDEEARTIGDRIAERYATLLERLAAH